MFPATTGNRGYSLIELLVVTTIIGILASVILFTVGEAREQARNSTVESEVEQLVKALDLYYVDYGQYPTSGQLWDCLGEDRDGDGNCATNASNRYLYENNSSDITDQLSEYIAHDQLTNYAEIDEYVEGILYRSTTGSSGYELIYYLEGTNRTCQVGVNRNDNHLNAGRVTSCTVCGGDYENPNWCVDLL